MTPGADMARFVRELAEFVALGADELALVRRTAPVVLAHEAELTAAVYEHFLRFPASAAFFLREDGDVDRARVERRKHSLGRWLRDTAEAALTHDFAYYLLSIGLAHSHRPHGPGGRIPPHFLVGTMSLVQSSLARIFAAELGDGCQALDASVAWNKILLVQLSVFLLGYVPPS